MTLGALTNQTSSRASCARRRLALSSRWARTSTAVPFWWFKKRRRRAGTDRRSARALGPRSTLRRRTSERSIKSDCGGPTPFRPRCLGRTVGSFIHRMGRISLALIPAGRPDAAADASCGRCRQPSRATWSSLSLRKWIRAQIERVLGRSSDRRWTLGPAGAGDPEMPPAPALLTRQVPPPCPVPRIACIHSLTFRPGRRAPRSSGPAARPAPIIGPPARSHGAQAGHDWPD
jgi:hypothetical protein